MQEDSCRLLPGGSSRAWRRRVGSFPGEQGWAGRSPGQDSAPLGVQPLFGTQQQAGRGTATSRNGTDRGFRYCCLSRPSAELRGFSAYPSQAYLCYSKLS